MGSIPVANPAPVRWRPPFLVAALAAAVAAALIALLAVFAWPEGGPTGTVVGRVGDFEVGQPVHFEEHAVWVVRGIEDRFLAFSDDDPRIAGQHDCRVEWNPGRVVSGEQGVFETCTGYLFHPGGTTPVFWSVAAAGPVFYSAEAKDGGVVVSLDEPYCNARFPYPGPCHSVGADTIAPQPVIVPQED